MRQSLLRPDEPREQYFQQSEFIGWRSTRLQERLSAGPKTEERLEKTPGGRWFYSMGPGLQSCNSEACSSSPTEEGTSMERTVKALFPDHLLHPQFYFGREEDFPLFSIEEFEISVLSLKRNKAPQGYWTWWNPQQITNFWCILRVFTEEGIFNKSLIAVEDVNACLSQRFFPPRWKMARLVLIGKGESDPGLLFSSRALCLFVTGGETFERLVLPRLNSSMKPARDVSPAVRLHKGAVNNGHNFGWSKSGGNSWEL